MTTQEKQLLEMFRELKEEGQRLALAFVKVLLDEKR